MPLMQWSPKLSVSVRLFDDDHRDMLGMINQLYDHMLAGRGADVLGQVVDGLVTYTQSHFAHEERYFAQHGYPDARAHELEHEEFARRVLDLQARFKAGATVVLTMEVLNVLKDWLVEHIQGSDQRYVAFFAAKGVR